MAEEAKLEQEHGGKEGLAKWRADNASRLEADRIAKREADAKAAADKKITDEMADLRVELANLPSFANSAAASTANNGAHFQINKAQTKQHFHLTDKELESLPKQVIQKEGAKRPSKILWSSVDIFACVARKEGKAKLRQYQASYSPVLARSSSRRAQRRPRQAPGLRRGGRAAAVARLKAADAAARANAAAARTRVEEAIRALDAAQGKASAARDALYSVATGEEVDAMALPDLPHARFGDLDAEAAEAACPAVSHSTHPAKRTASTTPFTANGGGAKGKRQRVTSQADKPAANEEDEEDEDVRISSLMAAGGALMCD